MRLLIHEINAVTKSMDMHEYDRQFIPLYFQSSTTQNEVSICPDDPKKWKNHDVNRLLEENQLGIFRQALKKFTGNELCELYWLTLFDPINYCQRVE